MMTSITLNPGSRAGTVPAPPSKSAAHRLLILAALSDRKSTVVCGELSKDILATIRCLRALGAEITEETPGVFSVVPGRKKIDELAVLFCGESGSTLRFLLPVCGALGVSAVFKMEGRLPDRPLSPLDEVLSAHGMNLWKNGSDLFVSGTLQSGRYEIPGNISSQYISGLLMALPLLDGGSVLSVTGKLESAAYVKMTESAVTAAGGRYTRNGNDFLISGRQVFSLPENTFAEGDYSGAAFFLCMGALSEKGITVTNLPADTLQGDAQILSLLKRFGALVSAGNGCVTVRKNRLTGCEIDASGIPDLVPVLSVLACAAEGSTVIKNAARLRLKESDRLFASAKLIRDLGGSVEEFADGLMIQGAGQLKGGSVSSFNDHRIAMSAAAAVCFSKNSVTVWEPECTDKSFPHFWECLNELEIEK